MAQTSGRFGFPLKALRQRVVRLRRSFEAA